MHPSICNALCNSRPVINRFIMIVAFISMMIMKAFFLLFVPGLLLVKSCDYSSKIMLVNNDCEVTHCSILKMFTLSIINN